MSMNPLPETYCSQLMLLSERATGSTKILLPLIAIYLPGPDVLFSVFRKLCEAANETPVDTADHGIVKEAIEILRAGILVCVQEDWDRRHGHKQKGTAKCSTERYGFIVTLDADSARYWWVTPTALRFMYEDQS